MILYVNPSSHVNKFCIHLHGNACDVGQIAMCAEREGRAYDGHYLLVEYPRYGIADGHPNERILNAVALAVYEFVVGTLAVPPAQVVLMGRSIGELPAPATAATTTTTDERMISNIKAGDVFTN